MLDNLTLLSNMAAARVPSSVQEDAPEVLCKRCGGGGSDVRILDCGCTLHAVSKVVAIFFALSSLYSQVCSIIEMHSTRPRFYTG